MTLWLNIYYFSSSAERCIISCLKGLWNGKSIVLYQRGTCLHRFQALNVIVGRVTIRAIFHRRVLTRISILPKIYLFWLCLRVQTDRCMTSKYHTDGSLCFQNALKVLWCQTLIGLSRAALSRTHLICTCICIALTVDPTFSHTMIVHNVQFMLLVKLLFNHYLQEIVKQSQNKSWQGRVREKWHVWSP